MRTVPESSVPPPGQRVPGPPGRPGQAAAGRHSHRRRGRGNGDGCTADTAERSALDQLGTAVRAVGHGAQFRDFCTAGCDILFSLGHRGDQPRKGILGVLAVQLHVLLADHAVQRIDAVFLRRNLRVKPRDVRQVLALLSVFVLASVIFLLRSSKKAMSFSRPFWKFSLPIIIQIAPYFVNAYWDFLEGKCQLILYGPKLHFDDGHLHHAIACNALHS